MREKKADPPAGANNPATDSSFPRERQEHSESAEPSARSAAELPWDVLETEIVSLVGRLSDATFDLLVLVGELDARGAWAMRGALSCASWLTHTCDIEPSTARNQVRVARAMREYPALHAAMAAGDISYSKARVLVAHLSDAHADELVELASTTPASRLRTAIAAWSHRNETDDEIDRRHQRERSVSWRTDADGMITITARLAPAEAGKVCAAIDKYLATNRDETRDRVPVETLRPPSLAQQRADALVRVCTTDVGGSVQPEVVVHVSENGNTLADGTPLTDHAVARLLPESFVSLLLHDAGRQPIDASPRRRFPTRRQQRVVDARSAECAHPGCHARVFLQYDHIVAYDDGGPTVVENLQRLCGPHNRAKELARRHAGDSPPPRPDAAA